jgi:hypothetical protein
VILLVGHDPVGTVAAVGHLVELEVVCTGNVTVAAQYYGIKPGQVRTAIILGMTHRSKGMRFVYTHGGPVVKEDYAPVLARLAKESEETRRTDEERTLLEAFSKIELVEGSKILT